MKRLLTEPLVHFLALGALLFAIFPLARGDDEAREDRIVVPAGRIEHLAAIFARTWNRPPTRFELEGLVDDFVREEVAYREGMALGLDTDDTIIRRRVRQKLEFIAEDLAGQVEPTEDVLRAHLATHADEFRIDPRMSFRQVYFDPTRHGDGLSATLRDTFDALAADPAADARAMGDRTLLEHAYDDVSAWEVARLFGPAFAAELEGCRPRAWSGPIDSAYGTHLVIVDERIGGRVPDLDEVRPAVERAWGNARRLELIAGFYRQLLERHDVVIEWPDPEARDE